MKTTPVKSIFRRIASWSIIGILVAGSLLIFRIADIGEGSGLMARIFILFLGAIIVVQIIPGLMLLGAMLKAVCSMFGKKAKAEVRGQGK
jgi:hypothetical protein